MPGTLFWILLFVSQVFIISGTISILFPRAYIRLDRRIYHKLRLVSKDKLDSAINRRSVIFERVQGCVFLVLGILLIKYLGVLMALFSGGDHFLSNAAETETVDFRSAVRAVVAAEGLLLDTPEELRIISAEYGARDTWIDVTERVREKTDRNILTIEAGNAIGGDPVFGVPKRLKVEYELNGERKTAEVREGGMLRVNDPYDELEVISTPDRLVGLAEACPAEVGFFGKNFTTGKTVEYRADQPACLASIVKIFPLLEVMRRAEQGSLDLAAPIIIERQKGSETCTVSEALDKMIGLSDNDATAAVAQLVGYDAINALPKRLGITGLSEQILPAPGVLDKVLDTRVYRLRVPTESDLLPQHGTARGIVQYFELLHKNELLNEKISQRVLEVFDRNPKYFAPRATPANFSSGGKGGGIGWVRPFRPPYNMGGWGILIRSETVAVGFCVWCEWFPASMGEDERVQWLHGLSDCIVNILLLSHQQEVVSDQ